MRSALVTFALCAVGITLALPSAADQLMVNGKSRTYTIAQPATGYKGSDSFNLSMQEHNGGRRATMSVKVSVTIQ
jgi:hypothetical protein